VLTDLDVNEAGSLEPGLRSAGDYSNPLNRADAAVPGSVLLGSFVLSVESHTEDVGVRCALACIHHRRRVDEVVREVNRARARVQETRGRTGRYP
jgi:hypothetical protein